MLMGNLSLGRPRMPTFEEYEFLAKIVGGSNDLMHWSQIFSWCLNKVGVQAIAAGHMQATSRNCYRRSDALDIVGFRPAFPISHGSVKDGERVPVATLYANGIPIAVPKTPMWCGDIPNYKEGTVLEFREPIANPEYQIFGIKAGYVMIADRVVLKKVSWDELAAQGFIKTPTPSPIPKSEPVIDPQTEIAALREENATLKELLRKEKTENQVLRARVFELEMERV